MIDAQALHEHSLKHRLEQRERQGLSIDPDARRSDTVHGFLSVAEANRVLEAADPKTLLHERGLVAIFNHSVVFLAGEGSYAFDLLKPRGFRGISQTLPLALRPPDDQCIGTSVMRTAEHFLCFYFNNYVHLDTVEQLLDYLNHGQLPADACTVGRKYGQTTEA